MLTQEFADMLYLTIENRFQLVPSENITRQYTSTGSEQITIKFLEGDTFNITITRARK